MTAWHGGCVWVRFVGSWPPAARPQDDQEERGMYWLLIYDFARRKLRIGFLAMMIYLAMC